MPYRAPTPRKSRKLARVGEVGLAWKKPLKICKKFAKRLEKAWKKFGDRGGQL
jgi:hypothetical protein